MSDEQLELNIESVEVQRESGKSNEEVAKEVIAGVWGRGNVRNDRLGAAGYDVTAINEEVNKVFDQS